MPSVLNGKIEFNEQFTQALDLMDKTAKNVLITGRAGTGKSTLLEYFRSKTKKSVAVLAPTGVAALNVKGQTVHSFFGFKPNISTVKVKRRPREQTDVYRALDAIVIDEVSMVRADVLDCVNKFLCLNGRDNSKAFGGTQMILIGDPYQLAPVISSSERDAFARKYVSPYFFDSEAFKSLNAEVLELQKVYRQKDENFIRLLNAVRNNTATEEDFKSLNKRVNPNFQPMGNEMSLTLTPRNDSADEINARKLGELPGRKEEYHGEMKGEFSKEYLPNAVDLEAKVGAQVMLLNNDSAGRWVNGSVGVVTKLASEDDEILEVKLSEGEKVEVTPHKWQVFSFFYDNKTSAIDSKQVGSFTQYPFRLAWAITIHKSQGKTFDNVVIDMGKGAFAHGQTYVALSRCRSLEGLVLTTPLSKKLVFRDWRVAKFMSGLEHAKSEKEMPLEQKVEVLTEAAKNKKHLNITYLKATDELSERIILPIEVKNFEYHGKEFLGVRAHCFKASGERTFRVDRIISMKD